MILQTYFMLMNNFCSSLNINKLQKRVGRGLNPYHLFMKKDALLKKQIWQLTNRTVSDIFFTLLLTQHMSIIFLPPGIYNMIQIKSIVTKQVDFKTSLSARPHALKHWLCSLLRTYERSTCRKSRVKERFWAPGWREDAYLRRVGTSLLKTLA